MGSTTPLADALLSQQRLPVYQRPSRRSLKTPAPSPSSWKDTLKQSCLQRARQKKQEALLWRNRLQNNNDASTTNQEAARKLVEMELRDCGVAILEGDEVEMDTDMSEGVARQEDHAISESELYELMQEVEEELKRDEARRLDQEMEEVELCEQLNSQHIENEIAEFQDWENNDENHERVLCPLCKEANLLQLSSHDVACPNNMNGSCPLRIGQTARAISLSDLRERLGIAYEVHACSCSSPLEFQLQQRENYETTLVAICHTCDSNVYIL